MSHDLYSELTIYSLIMAVTGYFLIATMFLGGAFLSIILAVTASLGAFIFLNYLKGKSHFWWIGVVYPLLLILIIIAELFSFLSSGAVYGPGMTSGRLKGILYFLIAPASLFFYAAMTPEFRKIMKVPFLIAIIISIFMLIPVYDELSTAYFPQDDGKIIASDVTGGFMILVFGGFYGMTALGILGLISGLKISGILRAELLSGRPMGGGSQYE